MTISSLNFTVLPNYVTLALKHTITKMLWWMLNGYCWLMQQFHITPTLQYRILFL